jgi:hypothetical protein
LPAALPRTDDLNGHVLVALGQLPDLLRQDIKSVGPWYWGCSWTISLRTASSPAC